MKKKIYLLLWIIALLLYALIMPLRGVNFQWASVAHSVVFAILTWWTLAKFAHKTEFWQVMLPLLAPWLFELVARLIIGENLFSLSAERVFQSTVKIFPYQNRDFQGIVPNLIFYR